jgi:uncharacterized protein YndB with AHSA1/START domain
MPAPTGFVTAPSLTLKRRLNAAPEKIYAAWTEPQKLMQWLGPAGATMLVAEADVRVGGKYRFVMRTPDGEQHEVSGVYREVVQNEKLVFTWAWISTPERESLVTMLIKRVDGISVLTLTHEQFFDEAARENHQTGWTGALDKLEKFVA